MATESGRLIAAPTFGMWDCGCRGGNLPPAGEHSSPLRCVPVLFVGAICDRPLCCRIQHILDKDAVAHGGIVYEDMGDGADELAVLDDRRA